MKWNLARECRAEWRLPPAKDINDMAQDGLNTIRSGTVQVPSLPMPAGLAGSQGVYNPIFGRHYERSRLMARIALTSGAYQARSIIANAQRSRNLYVEANPPEDNPPVPFTIYPRPGLKLLAKCPTFGIGRNVYCDSQGNLYAVAGQTVYYIDPNFNFNALGTIAPGTSIVSMADNATTVLMVDGTTAGYTIDVQSKAFATISDPAFYGGNWVNYVRTVFAINRPRPSSSISPAPMP
jgi:hypothetical protein